MRESDPLTIPHETRGSAWSVRWRGPLERPRPPGNSQLGTGCFLGGSVMISSGLTFSVINRASLRDGYVRVRDSGVVTADTHALIDPHARTELGSLRACQRLRCVTPARATV